MYLLKTTLLLPALLVSLIVMTFPAVGNAQQPLVETYLMSGKLSEGETALKEQLKSNPSDDQTRFGLGVLKFMQAVEHLGQSWYRYGINDNMTGMAFIRLPVPENPKPEKVTYQDVRTVLEEMIAFLDESEQTLAKVKSNDVKLPLHLFQLHLDIDKNGQLSPEEDLTDIYATYLGREFVKNREKLNEKVVVFDYADVQWLRGYTHLIRAMCETILAYDEKPLWDVIGYFVFKKPEFRFKFMEEEYAEAQKKNNNNRAIWNNRNAIMDAIAGVHNLNFSLKEPDRLKKAHQHLKQAIVQSRKMWTAIKAESDDDREWIPNQNQTSVVSLTRINKEMLKTWDDFLNEVDAILDGKKLLPFWRGTDETRGVNLHKVFHEPQDFDVILWVHGSAAVPYLEHGDVTKPETWNQYQRAFNGQFFSFAAWFN